MSLFPATNLLGETFRAAPTLLSKKVPSGCLGQVDFLGGQVTFKAYLSNGQGAGKSSSTKSLSKTNKKWPQASKM